MWAQDRFPLAQAELVEVLKTDLLQLVQETNSERVARAYLLVMPLLWEEPAIRAASMATGESPLPLIMSPEEAVAVARNYEAQMTGGEVAALDAMLRVPPL